MTEEDYIKEVQIELDKLKSPYDEEFDSRFYKAVANWLINPISAYLNKEKVKIEDFPVNVEYLRTLICYVEFTNLITFNIASTQVLSEMINNPEEHPWDIINRLGLIQDSNEDNIKKIAEETILNFPDKVMEYKNGKTGLLGFFVGAIMKAAGKDKINPKIVNEITKELLSK